MIVKYHYIKKIYDIVGHHWSSQASLLHIICSRTCFTIHVIITIE